MTSHTARAYDTLVLHNPKLVLIALFSILLFFGYHTKDFKLDASADSLLLEDDADLKVFRKIHERYPSSDLLIVTFTPNEDLFSNKALDTLAKLRGELGTVKSIKRVFSILDAPLFNSSDTDIQEMIVARAFELYTEHLKEEEEETRAQEKRYRRRSEK